MAIVSTDIVFYLSGGAGNSDPNASLGGAISTTPIDLSTTLHNLFDKVTGDEASAGDTEYRCFYVKNNHGSLTWESVVGWIQTESPSTDTSVEIALAAAGKNGTAETLTNESTAPSGGESFVHPTDKASGIAVGDLAHGDYYPIYIKRIVGSSAAAYNADGPTLRLEGDTAA